MHRQLVRGELYPLLDKLIFAIFVLFLPFALGSGEKIFGDGDSSWHIAAGRWILAHGRVPTSDPFSLTMGGHPWVAFEWLSQIIYASAFDAAGYAGVAAVVSLAIIALHLIVFLFLRARVGPVAMLVAFVAMDAILITFVLARPHVLVWPVAAAWTVVLLNNRDKGRAPPLRLALLMLLWANLHGSFILGFIIAGAVGLDALIVARWSKRAFTDWLLFGLVALVAALLNANGIAGLIHPITVMGLDNLAFIAEWQPSNPSLTPLFYAILFCTLGFMLVRGAKLALGETLLLLFLLLLAFLQVRQQAWLAMVAPLILAPRLGPQGRDGAVPLFASAANRQMWLAAAGIGLLLAVMARLALPLQPTETVANPRTLLAHIPSVLRSKPVFNEYSFGGPLILAGIKPYIDGRSDMYGDAFMADYAKISDGEVERFDQAVRKYGIMWTVLPPKMRLTKALDHSPEWRRIYADKVGVIHVRRTGAAVHGAAR